MAFIPPSRLVKMVHGPASSTPTTPATSSDVLRAGISENRVLVVFTPGGGLTPTVPDTGNTLTNGSQLQTAINNAPIGSTIILQSGATYETNSANGFTFPAKGASWDNRRVTICCSRIGDLAAGARVAPSQTALFAKLVTGQKGPTLNFSGSRGWTLQGLEVSYTAACQTGASVQRMVDLTNADADITLERCWVHPRESVTAPSSIFRATSDGIGGIQTVKNFSFVDSYLDGFTGWGYSNVINHSGGLYTDGGSHLRVKNNFLQAYRTWYLEGQALPNSADVVIQRNTFDSPPAWEALTNPSGTSDGITPATIMQDDHRHLIIYAGTNILIVGNLFTGATRGSLGMFFYQTGGGAVCRYVSFLSNFLDSPKYFLSQLSNWHSPYQASDISFVNNLVRGGPFVSGQNSAWSIEFGGPEPGDIAAGVPLTAGHGLNVLHNTFRNLFDEMFHPQGHPSAFCDVRYNITFATFNWMNTSNVNADYPNLLMATNRFIGGSNRPAYISADQDFATDAAAGLGNAAAGDAGGSITNYILTSGTAQADAGTDHGCNITALQAALGGTSTDWDYPELPRASVDTTYSLPTGGTLRTPANSAALVTALANAVLGDVIQLTAGVTYSGNFTLANKGAGSAWIYIVSSALGSLPAAGTRVGPANAANMPKVSTANTDAVFTTAPGAHHYRFVGIEITTSVVSGLPPYFLVNTDGDSTLANMPHHITFDRCYLHGSSYGTIKGIRLQSATTGVVDSYFSDFKANNAGDRPDCNAIHTSFSAGPIKIQNNHMEATGEIFLSGGEDSPIAQLVPADIEIRNNHFFKPLAWNPFDGVNYGGVLYAVKNHL
jgi:hypothetical protein